MALVHIELDWSDEKGSCYDCGLPAAYSSEGKVLCSICAATHAADGEQIVNLYKEED